MDPWIRALQGGEFATADRLQLVTLFKYLEFCLEQVRAGRGVGQRQGGSACRFVARPVESWRPSPGPGLTLCPHPPPPRLPPPRLPKVVKDNELGALREALNGEYTEPGPGGDPIRNPSVLPTGKNIHALDPQSIPTAVSAPAWPCWG